VAFAAVAVALTLVVGTLVGLLLHRLGRRMAAFVASGVMLAWAMPSITASIVFKWLFNDTYGVVNWTLDRLPDQLARVLFGRAEFAGYSWFNGTLTTFAVLVTVVVWQSFPFVAVTVLAGCKTVPADLYEAGRIDGAGGWRTFWSITFPILRPVFAVLVILSTIWDFKVFTQLYVIAGQANRDAYMLSLYAYAEAFASPPRFGSGSALAVVLVLILLVVTLGYVRLTLRQERL
jgi:N,N'-diacetylchitobiose transport system permease protein